MRILILLYFLGIGTIFYGQAYKVGDKVENIPIGRILNQQKQATTLFSFEEDILILDFFGTWCAPCVRALPVFSALQKGQKEKLAILLVSIEEEKQLQSFIKQRTPFDFPVIVDSKEIFTQLFNPPSYPYTVVLGPDRTIIAITEANKISEEQINIWLQKYTVAKPVEVVPDPKKNTTEQKVLDTVSVNSIQNMVPENDVIDLSERFIYAAKTGNDATELIQALAKLSFDSLQKSLQTDNEKKSFWINLYNGFTQLRLKKDASLYSNRSKFYGSKEITIAGKEYSLDDIEHGILRRSSIKWSLGYLHKWFPSKKEKLLRVNQVDYRIHFALNCGAKSCPPIAAYKAKEIDKQLDIATKVYLTGEAEYDEKNNQLKLPALMSWFRYDFGGKQKMIELMQKLSLVPKKVDPTIKFKKYDWTLYLNNYSQ